MSTIKRVKFTYALDGGLWIERTDGSKEWMSFSDIAREVGDAESDRMSRIAGECSGQYRTV